MNGYEWVMRSTAVLRQSAPSRALPPSLYPALSRASSGLEWGRVWAVRGGQRKRAGNSRAQKAQAFGFDVLRLRHVDMSLNLYYSRTSVVFFPLHISLKRYSHPTEIELLFEKLKLTTSNSTFFLFVLFIFASGPGIVKRLLAYGSAGFEARHSL